MGPDLQPAPCITALPKDTKLGLEGGDIGTMIGNGGVLLIILLGHIGHESLIRLESFRCIGEQDGRLIARENSKIGAATVKVESRCRRFRVVSVATRWKLNGEGARAQEGARCGDRNHLGLLRGPYSAY